MFACCVSCHARLCSWVWGKWVYQLPSELLFIELQAVIALMSKACSSSCALGNLLLLESLCIVGRGPTHTHTHTHTRAHTHTHRGVHAWRSCNSEVDVILKPHCLRTQMECGMIPLSSLVCVREPFWKCQAVAKLSVVGFPTTGRRFLSYQFFEGLLALFWVQVTNLRGMLYVLNP